MWPIEYGRSDGESILRLIYKRQHGFFVLNLFPSFSLSLHLYLYISSLWERLPTMSWGYPGQLSRSPCGEELRSPANNQGETEAATTLWNELGNGLPAIGTFWWHFFTVTSWHYHDSLSPSQADSEFLTHKNCEVVIACCIYLPSFWGHLL